MNLASHRLIFGIAGAIIFGIAIFFSTFALTESPKVWYDEGYYLQLAMNQSQYGVLEVQAAPGQFLSAGVISGGFPFIYPISYSFDLFGKGILQARSVMVAFTLLFLLASFFLIQKLFGTRVALLSSLLLVTFPSLYANGKSVQGELPGLLYLTLFLISLWQIERTQYKSLWPYLSTALFAGFCMVSKPIFILLAPAILVTVLLYRKQIEYHWNYIIPAFCLSAAILLYWLITQFAVTDSSSSILGYYANPYIIENIWNAIFQNILRFFKESTPLYLLVFFLSWAIAIFFRWRLKVKISMVEACAFVFSVLILCFYVRTAGWYRYFFPAQIVVFMFLPSALDILAERIQTFAPFKFRRFVLMLPTAFLILLGGFQFYLLSFHSWVSDTYKSTTNAELTAYFNGFDPTKSVWLYDVPEVVPYLNTTLYYQYLPIETPEMKQKELDYVQKGIPDFVILPAGKNLETDAVFSKYKQEKEIQGYLVFRKK